VYLEITNKCNFTCSFCIASAVHSSKGKYMTLADVDHALSYASKDEYIFVGGGEPTLHRDVFEIIDLIYTRGFKKIHITTNGSDEEAIRKLIKLTDTIGLIVVLSLDKYHDPIDDEVIALFAKPRRQFTSYRVGIRHTPDTLIVKGGRSKEGFDGCPHKTHGVHVNPDGTWHMCDEFKKDRVKVGEDIKESHICIKPNYPYPHIWYAPPQDVVYPFRLGALGHYQELDDLDLQEPYLLVGSGALTGYGMYPYNNDIDIKVSHADFARLKEVNEVSYEKTWPADRQGRGVITIGNIHILEDSYFGATAGHLEEELEDCVLAVGELGYVQKQEKLLQNIRGYSHIKEHYKEYLW